MMEDCLEIDKPNQEIPADLDVENWERGVPTDIVLSECRFPNLVFLTERGLA